MWDAQKSDMLSAFTELRHYSVQAADGPAGRVEDLQFDDLSWVVLHLVVRPRGWRSGRRFLLPVTAVQSVDAAGRTCTFGLTRSKVERSPAAAVPPVSRQHHITLYDAKGLPHTSPGPAPHLRSARAVIGSVVDALDGEAGRVRDLLIDGRTWAIRYLVIDTGEASRQALIGPEWVTRANWEERAIHVDVYRGHIDKAPMYDQAIPLTRDYEQRLYAHYGRAGYWHGSPSR